MLCSVEKETVATLVLCGLGNGRGTRMASSWE